MKRNTPIRAKRPTPRRNEGRIQHKRMKPKATGMTTEERLHIAFVRSLGCLICGASAEAHHIMHAPGKSKRRDHRFVVPLCHIHHRTDVGVHGLGSEDAFRTFWGVDLVGWSIAAWPYRNSPDAPFWTESVTRWRGVARPKLMSIKGGLANAKLDDTRSSQP